MPKKRLVTTMLLFDDPNLIVFSNLVHYKDPLSIDPQPFPWSSSQGSGFAGDRSSPMNDDDKVLVALIDVLTPINS